MKDYYIPREEGSLKQAQADLIRRCGGPGMARTRVKKSVLHAASSNDDANRNRHLAADVILDLEQQARDPVVSRFMLLCQGWLPVPLPRPDAGTLPHMLMAVLSEGFAKVLHDYALALEDGRLSASEARTIKQDCMRLAVPLAGMIAVCDGVIDREGK